MGIRFLTFLASFILFQSCFLFDTDEVPASLEPIDFLPPVTNTGENTLGFLANNVAIRFVDEETTVSSNVFFNDTTLAQGIIIQSTAFLGGFLSRSRDDFQITIFDFEGARRYTPQTDSIIIEASFENLGFISQFDSLSGSFDVHTFDESTGIIAGIFEFTAFRNGLENLIISEGRFDLTLEE